MLIKPQTKKLCGFQHRIKSKTSDDQFKSFKREAQGSHSQGEELDQDPESTCGGGLFPAFEFF